MKPKKNYDAIIYDDYIHSKAWQQVRARYEAKYPKQCYICDGQEKIHLHHKTYKRLGNERLGDLCWLCEECHAIIHNIVNQQHHGALTLWDAAKRYGKIYRKYGRASAERWSRQWEERKAQVQQQQQKHDWTEEIARAERELKLAHAELEIGT